MIQAEDGMRYDLVTGVQTCALPICSAIQKFLAQLPAGVEIAVETSGHYYWLVEEIEKAGQIGRASGRERGEISGVAGSFKKKEGRGGKGGMGGGQCRDARRGGRRGL